MSAVFDNLKVFYHPVETPYPVRYPDAWRFYIAPRDGQQKDCYDWRRENFDIRVCGVGDLWGDIRSLVVCSGDRVRISYRRDGERRTQELIFPSEDPAIPVLYLPAM